MKSFKYICYMLFLKYSELNRIVSKCAFKKQALIHEDYYHKGIHNEKKSTGTTCPGITHSWRSNAAEMYNKDGNKLDLYGKVDARHVFSDDAHQDGDATYVRLGFKGETQINSDLIGFGQWEYNIQANGSENTSDSATRLGFAGLKFGDYGSFDYGRNYGVVYDVEAGPTCCRYGAVTLILTPITS